MVIVVFKGMLSNSARQFRRQPTGYDAMKGEQDSFKPRIRGCALESCGATFVEPSVIGWREAL